jgi:hypothetical protein
MSEKTNNETDDEYEGFKRTLAFSGSLFEVDEMKPFFTTTYAVFRKGSDSSICYVTSVERGELIVKALDHFQECGKLDEWFDSKRKPNETAHAEATADSVNPDG